MNEKNPMSIPPAHSKPYYGPPREPKSQEPHRSRKPFFRAAVVDPHPRRRRAFVGRLKTMGAERVIEGGTPHGFRAGATEASRVHVAVLYAAGDTSALEKHVGDLYRRGADRVLVIAGARDPAFARAAFDADAVGYLVNSSQPAVGPAPRKPPAEDRRVVAEFALRKAVLSEREIEILCLVADGRTNQEIGTELMVSPNTVKGHLAHLARKLQTGDRSRMVLLALRAGVIS